jgi:hypothetical protein
MNSTMLKIRDLICSIYWKLFFCHSQNSVQKMAVIVHDSSNKAAHRWAKELLSVWPCPQKAGRFLHQLAHIQFQRNLLPTGEHCVGRCQCFFHCTFECLEWLEFDARQGQFHLSFWQWFAPCVDYDIFSGRKKLFYHFHCRFLVPLLEAAPFAIYALLGELRNKPRQVLIIEVVHDFAFPLIWAQDSEPIVLLQIEAGTLFRLAVRSLSPSPAKRIGQTSGKRFKGKLCNSRLFDCYECPLNLLTFGLSFATRRGTMGMVGGRSWTA